MGRLTYEAVRRFGLARRTGGALTKDRVEAALAKHGGNASAAAAELGVSRGALLRAKRR